VFAHLPDARGKLCGQHMRHISHGKYGCQYRTQRIWFAEPSTNKIRLVA
jgi:hypothetical protein